MRTGKSDVVGQKGILTLKSVVELHKNTALERPGNASYFRVLYNTNMMIQIRIQPLLTAEYTTITHYLPLDTQILQKLWACRQSQSL